MLNGVPLTWEQDGVELTDAEKNEKGNACWDELNHILMECGTCKWDANNRVLPQLQKRSKEIQEELRKDMEMLEHLAEGEQLDVAAKTERREKVRQDLEWMEFDNSS